MTNRRLPLTDSEYRKQMNKLEAVNAADSEGSEERDFNEEVDEILDDVMPE